MRASYLMSGVATGLRRNLSMTIALILSTAICLAFAGSAILGKREIVAFRKLYEDKLKVSVFLCTSTSGTATGSRCKHQVTDSERTAIQTMLQNDPLVAHFIYISEGQAVARAKQLIGADLVDAAGPGAIPSSYALTLKNLKTDYTPIAAKYSVLPGVDSVQNEDESVKQLLKIFDAVRTLSWIVALLISVAAVILMSLTIQLAAEQRKNETGIMRLVGATRWMTQLPFIIEAGIAATAGGLVSLALVAAGKYYVFDDLFKDQVHNKVIAGLNGNDVLVSGGLPMIGGIVLSAVIAWGTLRLVVKL